MKKVIAITLDTEAEDILIQTSEKCSLIEMLGVAEYIRYAALEAIGRHPVDHPAEELEQGREILYSASEQA